MMKIKTLILYTLLSLSMCGIVYAGPIVHRDGAVIPSGATLDIVDVEDWNVPAMQAAGAGFGESPIWRTDANTVTLKSATGQSVTLAFNADNGEDNSDKWQLVVADGGNVTLQTYNSGAWVTVATWTNAGGLTMTGALAGATLNTGQGAYELYAMNQDVESTDAVTFATVNTGQGANELYGMDQGVKTTDSPSFVAITEGANAVPNATDPLSFFAATTSAQLAGVLSDETGTLKSVFSDSPEFTTKITTPTIYGSTASGGDITIAGTSDATEGNVLLATSGGKVGIGTDAPASPMDVGSTFTSYNTFGARGNATASGGVQRAFSAQGTQIAAANSDNFRGFSTSQTLTCGAYTGLANYGLYIGNPSVTGTLANNYGVYIDNQTSGTTDYALYSAGGTSYFNGSVGIGTTSPDTRLHAELDDATTNATTNVQTLTHTTSGAPAANIGAGLALEVETAAGNNEVVGVIEGIATELATPGAEDGALVFKTMTAGAAASEKMRVTEYALATQARTVKKTNVSDANYGTSALTSDHIVAFTALTAARTATISTEDEDSGTTTQPRVMIFKDESGSAATYNITISLESGGTIDGAANFVIDQPYQSVTIYLNGTNGFIM